MSPPVVERLPTQLGPVAGLPTGVWDPLWNDPVVAAKVATEQFRGISHLPFGEAPLVAEALLPTFEHKRCVERTFTLGPPVEVGEAHARLRGGSYGEIFKRYAFGPRPASNFHTQAICFGVDGAGRYFVSAGVGLVGASIDNEAALVLRFVAGSAVIGGVAWAGKVTSDHDVELRLLGRDPLLAAQFDALSEVRVLFYARCPGA